MLVEKSGNKIPDPGNGASADDPDNTDEDEHTVLLANALDYSVNSPNNVERGDAEDKLNYPREVVNSFDKFVH